MDGDTSLKLTDREIAQCFSNAVDAANFPPVLTVEQAADLLQVPIGTIRDWRSRRKLSDCSARVGKYVRIYRDRLIKTVFNSGLKK